MFNLFDFYPDEIFKPLASKHRVFYWRLISDLYEAFYSDHAETDDSMVDEPVIRRAIEESALDYGVEVYENEGKEEYQNVKLDNLQTNISYIYKLLKDYGWLKTDKVGLKIGVYMPPRVGNLVRLLSQSRFDISDKLGSHVFVLRTVLLNLIEKKENSPEEVHSALKGAVENARNVSELMNTLSAEMLELYDKIGQVSELKIKANLFFNEFVETPTFRALQSINGNNHPYRYRAEIIQMIDQLEYGDIKDEILDKYKQSGLSEKKVGQYYSYLKTIRRIFSSAESLKSRVDTNHGKLIKRVSDSIHYQRRYKGSMDTFNLALKKLKSSDNDNAFKGNIYPLEIAFTAENLNLPPHKKPQMENTERTRKAIPKRKKIRSQLKREFRKLYRMNNAKVESYLESLFKDSPENTIDSSSIIIDEYYDYLCFSALRRLCQPSMKRKSRYQGTLDSYQIEILSHELSQHDVCHCRPFKITRKNHHV